MPIAKRKPLLDRYRVLLAQVDSWFAAARTAFSNEVQCRKGCDLCCRGLFDITPLDAALVREGFRLADAEDQRLMLNAAEQALAEVRTHAPRWNPPFRINQLGAAAFDALCDRLDQVPCPALAEDGGCRVYSHRPLVCRLHGIPMYDPVEEAYCGGECPRNFAPEGLKQKPALHFHHLAFEANELELIEELAGPRAAEDPEGWSTLIAAVILEEDPGGTPAS